MIKHCPYPGQPSEPAMFESYHSASTYYYCHAIHCNVVVFPPCRRFAAVLRFSLVSSSIILFYLLVVIVAILRLRFTLNATSMLAATFVEESDHDPMASGLQGSSFRLQGSKRAKKGLQEPLFGGSDGSGWLGPFA